MPKIYAASSVLCEAPGRHVHELVYMGQFRNERGVLQRSLEYRCAACGEFIKKIELQEATQDGS